MNDSNNSLPVETRVATETHEDFPRFDFESLFKTTAARLAALRAYRLVIRPCLREGAIAPAMV